MNRLTKFPLMASAALLLVCGACSKKENKEAGQQDQKPQIKVETVEQQMVDQIGTYTATVEADMVNNISSNAPNRIKAIYVDEGQRVSKGQKLVVLDDVNITAYQVQVDNAQANLDNIQREYNRALELYKIGGGTKQAVDQVQTQLTTAQNALRAAQRTLQNAQENTVLSSPINGIVTKRNYDPGDMTGGLPILTVSTVNPVKVCINVTEADLSRVHKGMDAAMTFDTYGDEQFTGVVSMVSPTVDAASRTFGVEITLQNPNDRILPGMFARVKLKLGEAEHVVVPDKAVVKQPGSGDHYVYVYNPSEGTVSYNKVQLGQRLGNFYEIISGVTPGSQVVVAGQSRLANGMAVELAK